MSWEALAWAGKCRPGSSSRKLVLFALADRHNDEVDGAYPSISWIADFTDLNRKTVIACLMELERRGFISDSGERRGETRQIKLYRLHLETVPEVEQSLKRNSSENDVKQSQKRDTDTVKEPVLSGAKAPSRARAKPKFELPGDIPAEPWAAFEEMRRKMGKAMTDYARNLAVKRLHRLAEDGWPPGEVLNHCILNNYQGIFPPKDRSNGHHQPNGLRGTRPDPSLDMLRDAIAEEAAGRGPPPDRGARASLPAIRPG